MKHTTVTILLTMLSVFTILGQTEGDDCYVVPDISSASDNSVGSIATSFSVSPLGSAQYSMAIEVPPGVGGMQPSLSLNYDSQSDMGIAGWGVNLSGLSIITRAPHDIFHDGYAGGLRHDYTDALCLDGRRLILVSGTEGQAGSTFHPEGDPYTTVTIKGSYSANSDNRWMEVTTPDGTTYEYGHTADSRQSYTTAEGKSRINAWYVSRSEDVQGNYISYSYGRDSLYVYPASIAYGDNIRQANSLADRVDFLYESIGEAHLPFRLEGVAGVMDKRLKKIICKSGQSIFRQYTLTYDTSEDETALRFPRLIQVEAENGNGSRQFPVQMVWKPLPSFTRETTTHVLPLYSSTYSPVIREFFAADLTGDGLSDLIEKSQTNDTVHVLVHSSQSLPNGTVTFSQPIELQGIMAIPQDWTRFCSPLTGDFNGDGTGDLGMICFDYTHLCHALNITHGSSLSSDSISLSEYRTSYAPLYLSSDFNGDGYHDVLLLDRVFNNGGYNLTLVQGSSSGLTSSTRQHAMLTLSLPNTPSQLLCGDYDGDGLDDILVLHAGGYKIFWNSVGNVSGSQSPFSDLHATEKTLPGSNIAYSQYASIYQGDFNGDALPDLLLENFLTGKLLTAFSEGNGDFSVSETYAYDQNDHYPGLSCTQSTIIVHDMDGDGRDDVFIIRSYNSSSGNYHHTTSLWLVNTGMSFTKKKLAHTFLATDALWHNLLLGDFDGDGHIELMNYGNDLYTQEFNYIIEQTFRRYYNPFHTASCGHVTSFTDGNDNTLAIQYDYLTRPDVYHQGSTPVPPAAISPTLPLTVAKSLVRSDGVVGNCKTSYSYERLLLHRQGRGVLGFSSVSAIDSVRGRTAVMQTDSWDQQFLVPTQHTEYTIMGTDTATTVTTSTVYSQPQWSATQGRNFVSFPTTSLSTDFDGFTTTTTRTYDTVKGVVTLRRTTLDNPDMYRETAYTYTYAAKAWKPLETTLTMKNSASQASVTHRTTVGGYDGCGHAISVTENAQSPLALTTAYTYDVFGNVLSSVQTGLGISPVTTLHEYDATHRFVTRTYTSPSSTDISYTHNTWGNLLTETDNTDPSNPVTTTHTYDGWGRRTSTTSPTGAVTHYDTGWGSSPSQKWFTVSRPESGAWTKTWHDATGRETSTESKGMKNVDVTTSTTYDSRGRALRKTSTEGTLTTWEEYGYDNRDRVTSITRSTDSQTSYTYVPRKVTEVTDGRTFEKYFDAWGNVTRIDDDIHSVSYSYRGDGKMTSALGDNRGGGGSYIGYDTAGNRNSLNDASAGTTSYAYNALGQITYKEDARGKKTYYRYDALNRLVSENADGDSVVYAYGTSGTDKGRLVSITRGSLTLIYTYDKHGRTQSETRSFGPESYNSYTSRFSYDNSGRLTSKTLPGMYGDFSAADTLRIAYSYDGYGNCIGMNREAGGTVAEKLWQLTSFDGQNMEELLGDTVRRKTVLDSYGQLQQVRMRRGSSTLRQMNFQYNAVTGNLIHRTSLFNPAEDESFAYDDADRLTRWEQDFHAPAMEMTYSENGNISTKTNVGQYSYGYDWHRPFAVERVTNAQGVIPSSALSTQFDGRGMVSSIYEYGSWKEAIFTYGPDGERWKTVRQAYGEYDVERKYLGDMEITMSGPGMTRCNWYLGHGVMLFRDADNPAFNTMTPLYAFTDNQGSYIDFFRSNGTRVFEAKYDPWGVQTVVTDSIHFHRGYGGHEMLNYFGIINMGGRLYDPVLGRFLSPDNYVQEPFNTQNLNRYSYCLNNPVKYTDPSGNFHLNKWLGKNIFLGAVKGLFNGLGPIDNIGRQLKMSIKIFHGLFVTDSNKSTWGRTKELVSRFTWQLPQTYLGFHTANLLNEYGEVEYVGSKFGATAMASKTLNKFGAMTLGNFIVGKQDLRADENNSLFQHEYGHYLQSQSLGLGYLVRVGVPSFLQASFGGNHDFMNYEQDANMRAFRYFNENVPGFYTSPEEYNSQFIEWLSAEMKGIKYHWPKWDFKKNPLSLKDKHDIFLWYIDFLNPSSYHEFARKYRIRLFK